MKQISVYQVEDQPLGSGGMGRVLKGYTPTGVPVAIKEILPEFVMDFEFRARIDKEVNILKKLHNDNVVKVFDYFQLANNLYIVMELIEGVNIEQYVERNGAIPVERASQFMVQILQTMQYVHEQGIIHRDIKPSNIMIRPNGNICLLDFGIAKDINSTGGTQIGTVIGTDGYMSPEQADGMSIDHRTDIYSLACVFFYMLTAHHAYLKLGSDVETQLNIVNTPFPKISKYNKNVPSGIQAVMDRATEKNMLKRYQSCREFCSELMKVSGGGTQLNTGSRGQGISISVGRENCDICVSVDNYKVSRHHADIKLKEFTGGSFYVYTDCSSNGTMIDGQMYTKGMSCNIQKGKTPTIYLAGDSSCQLDWEEVKRIIVERLKEAGLNEQEDASGKTVTLSDEEVKELLGNDTQEDSIAVKISLGVISFMIPLLGFILYLVFRNKKRQRAKLCIRWASNGFLTGLLLGFLQFVILFLMLL